MKTELIGLRKDHEPETFNIRLSTLSRFMARRRLSNRANPGLLSVLLACLALAALPVALPATAPTTYYVNAANPTPVAPYTSWATAARVIQDAVDTAAAGDEIVVTNGTYSTGGKALAGYPLMTNRVAIDKAVTIRSVNGPLVTVIAGQPAPGTTNNGDGAIRCVYVGTNAVLSGFTLTNGHTRAAGDYYREPRGGGAWCESSGVLTNCTLTGNSASREGGGAYRGTLNNCTLSGNSAQSGGGASEATLTNCTLSGNSAQSGGGAYVGTLNNCTLSGNSAQSGGGAYVGALNNCTLTGNSAEAGGGAFECTLSNCTLAANSAYDGGGAYRGTLNNCTLTSNSAGENGGGASGGTLNNCTLTANSASGQGGGAYGDPSLGLHSMLNNCTLSGNSASDGGGAYQGTLNNCTLTANSAEYGGGASGGQWGWYCTLNNCILTRNSASGDGGGAYWGTLNHCTLTGNSALLCGGGAGLGTLNNCIVYYNTALIGANHRFSSLAYSCTTPLPDGPGNIDADPALLTASHLSAQSPCIGRGSPGSASGVDIDGEPWLDPPCMGADQFVAGPATGPLAMAITAAYTNVAVGFTVWFVAGSIGPITASAWDFGDGVLVSNRPYASHAWAAPGLYPVRLIGYNDSYPDGVSATVLVQVDPREVHYVNGSNAGPVHPYTNWAEAAVSIQEAIDAGTQIGRLVLVSDGVYAGGDRAVLGELPNRVVVPEGVEVRSVNGPLVTLIAGQPAPNPDERGNGNGAIRCVYVGTNAVLSGFTLTNGHTRTITDCRTIADWMQSGGGGAWCELGGVLTNCTLMHNSAQYGGGTWGGTLNHCTLTTNSAGSWGGGALGGTLDHCTLTANSASEGGGAWEVTLNHCTLTGNLAWNYGGGAYNGALNNCILTANSAYDGGGAYYGTLNNCILTANSASDRGGGVYGEWSPRFHCTLNNCIVYYNMALDGANYTYEAVFAYSCTTPLPEGSGNLDLEPLFVDTNGWSNLRLQSNSPCISAGNNAYAVGATDLDGNPRISGGTVDMGAYEFQALDPFHAWLQQYGLPTDGSADFTDSDGDGHNNWQEWRCGTDPTKALSVLRLLSVSTDGANVTLRWPGVEGVSYFLERSTDLDASPPFTLLATNLVGQAGTMSFIDTDAAPLAPLFYRLGVGD